MKTLALTLLFVLATSLGIAQNYSPNYPSMGGSSAATSPTAGGTVTGANQYRNSSGLIAGDDLIIDDTSGTLRLVGVSASGVVTASTVMVGNGSLTAPALTWINNTNAGWFRGGNNQFNFVNNGVIQIRLATTSFGLGVSGSTPSATLHVGSTCPATCVGSGMFNGSLAVNVGAAGTSTTAVGGGLFVSGTVLTSTLSGTTTLNISSTNITYSGTLNGVSDRRAKRDIQPLPPMLSKLMQLQPVSFERAGWEGRRELGFIAQDVAPIFPEVTYAPATREDMWAMNSMQLIAAQTRAMQEMQAEIDELRVMMGMHTYIPNPSLWQRVTSWLNP